MCSSISVTISSISWRSDLCREKSPMIISRRGSPPVKICNGRISRSLILSPLTIRHRHRHSPVSNGSRRKILNNSKNGSLASSNPLKRLVAVASSVISGSDCNTLRSFQPKSSSTSSQSACRFSTIRTSCLPSRSTVSRTAARARSSRSPPCHSAARAACMACSSRENWGFCATCSHAR